MNVSFKNKHVRDLCCCEKIVKKKLGSNIKLINIQMRLNDLVAFDNFAQVPVKWPWHRHILHRDYEGCYGINITGRWRFVVKPIWPDGIKKTSQNLCYVTHIVIEKVIDYHE